MDGGGGVKYSNDRLHGGTPRNPRGFIELLCTPGLQRVGGEESVMEEDEVEMFVSIRKQGARRALNRIPLHPPQRCADQSARFLFISETSPRLSGVMGHLRLVGPGLMRLIPLQTTSFCGGNGPDLCVSPCRTSKVQPKPSVGADVRGED